MYPFCRLTGSANVLVMPSLHAAHIGSRLLQKMGGTVIGPLVMGLVQTGADCANGRHRLGHCHRSSAGCA
jgi:phosphotransacetylase